MKSTLIGSILRQKCPRCRKGDMFVDNNPYHLKKLSKMPSECSECGQHFELEPGFFYGSMYVSYGFCVAIFIFNFIWMGLFLEASVWLFALINSLILIVLMPLIFRISRATYLNFFVKYKKPGTKIS